ncbi:MAG TPA: hypothetical protein VG651_17855, partial [Stellaceae bacterium]|nr:hypothetical protein [Stellaceae bacterium]
APAALAPAVQSAVSPVAPAPAVRSAASPVAPAPQPAPASPAAPAASDRILIRFDNRIAALTPSGIRSFDAAVIAWRGGKPVRLAIEGCEAGADFSNGSPCARRLLTLKRMLAENGIRDSKRLLGDTP